MMLVPLMKEQLNGTQKLLQYVPHVPLNAQKHNACDCRCISLSNQLSGERRKLQETQKKRGKPDYSSSPSSSSPPSSSVKHKALQLQGNKRLRTTLCFKKDPRLFTSAINTLREACEMFPPSTLPPTRYMFAAMTAPVPGFLSRQRGGSLLSLAAGAMLALPPLCVGKWWIDQYETDQLRNLKETAHYFFPHT